MDFATDYLRSSATEFRRMKDLADRALAQVGDQDLHRAPDPESNSLAILVQHIGGNLISRWTDFLTTDGEKPDRNRDGEFIDAGLDRAALLARWEKGWGCLLGTLDALRGDDLARSVTIRGEPHAVVRAIERSLSHTSYHVGQIVYLAKSIRSEGWQTLSIARGDSEAHTRRLRDRFAQESGEGSDVAP